MHASRPQFQQGSAMCRAGELDFPFTHAAKLHRVPNGLDGARQAGGGHYQVACRLWDWRES
ncbi:MAG: hypothetical protein EBU77_10570 [Betaproteobacteria bacterium]|nr:hypothetical protein [Betaproteobacteria bacterium]